MKPLFEIRLFTWQSIYRCFLHQWQCGGRFVVHQKEFLQSDMARKCYMFLQLCSDRLQSLQFLHSQKMFFTIPISTRSGL